MKNKYLLSGFEDPDFFLSFERWPPLLDSAAGGDEDEQGSPSFRLDWRNAS